MATSTVQKREASTGPASGAARPAGAGGPGLAGFPLVAVQAAVILFLASRFNLENDLFQVVMRVAMFGSLVHYLLPARLKLGFFVALSVGTLAWSFGLEQGRWNWLASLRRLGVFAAFGGTLIAICHLRVRFAVRVALLAGVAGLLALVRAGVAPLRFFDAVWPVFAAIFMFRTAIYLYDLSTSPKRPSLGMSLAYFFTFPNLWLYVAPVLDFRTFQKGYLSDSTHAAYQKGVVWIVRGIFQLLLWRLVYYQFYVDPARVVTGADLGQYLIGNVALYLRLSGQFHIMTGIFYLFGFTLPETHRRYFLASSFLDYWRRINIYWRDFIAKLFYFPLVVRFKSAGTKAGILGATAVAFFATWILHPYQFFWIRGTFPLEAKDLAFWGLLGVLVCVNAIRDMDNSRKRTISRRIVGWPAALKTAARTSATFMIITVLWSLWTCDSLAQWADIWTRASLATAGFCAAAMAAVFAASVVLEGPVAERTERLWDEQVENASWPLLRKAFASCLIPAFLMVAATSSRVYGGFLSPEAEAVLVSVFKNTPNKSDEEFMVRGYYEDLADTSRFDTLINDGFRHQPSDWVNLEDTPMLRRVADLRTHELVPSASSVVNGKTIRINRWGMRDGEYELTKPAGAVRLAVLGASHEMGYGVNNGEVFSDVLEQRLNSPGGRRVEVLNFAVNHYSPLSQVEVVKRKMLQFRPDVVLLFGHEEDVGVVMRLFAQALRQGVRPEYPFLQELMRRADINQHTPRSIAERRLIALWPEMIRWAYKEIAADCRAAGIRPVWVLQRSVFHEPGTAEPGRRMKAFAEEAGFTTVLLEDVFQGADPKNLIVAPWDTHPNAEGHRMIADGLLKRLPSLGITP